MVIGGKTNIRPPLADGDTSQAGEVIADRPDEAHRRQDLELMTQVSAHDRAAEARAVARLGPRIGALCRRALSDPTEAAEAIQTSLIEVLMSARTYKGESRLERWTDAIVARRIARVIRDRMRQREREADVDWEQVVAPASPSSAREEIPRGLEEYLGKISDDLRTVVLLRHVLDFNVDECAEMLEVSRNTVKDRLVRGRQALRRCIRRDLAVGRQGDES